jgi:hypothetical protein
LALNNILALTNISAPIKILVSINIGVAKS